MYRHVQSHIGPPSPDHIREALQRGTAFIGGMLESPQVNTERVVGDEDAISSIPFEIAVLGVARVAMDWGGSFVEADYGCPRPEVEHLPVIGVGI